MAERVVPSGVDLGSVRLVIANANAIASDCYPDICDVNR